MMKVSKIWRKLFGKKEKKKAKIPLLAENNNNDMQDGNEGVALVLDNSSVQNSLNIQQEQQHPQQENEQSQNKVQELVAVLDLEEMLDFVDGDMNSGPEDLKQRATHLIQMSVNRHFPQEPAEVEENLRDHLENIQRTILKELQRPAPWLEANGLLELLGCLIGCYHRHTFEHLSGLLKHINAYKEIFILLDWVVHTYLSQELLGHPDLQDMEVLKKIDLLLFTEWVTQAQDRLLENVQKNLPIMLEKILQNETSETKENDETFVKLYVDVIQCIDGILTTAEMISLKLSSRVQEVCFRELQKFLKRYIGVQNKILKKQARKAEPETIHFLKTLNNCKELKSFIQTKLNGINTSALEQTVASLENMEASTLKLLLKHVSAFTESHLKKHFKSSNKEIFYLIYTVKDRFPKLPRHPDTQKRVMDEVYQIITHAYLKHLVKRKQSKLAKLWRSDVGEIVSDDAALLHVTIADLAPGVRQWNLILMKVQEVLEDQSPEMLKVTVANILQECKNESCRVDMDLLSALLRWRGDLSRRQVKEVLDACPRHDQL